MAHHRRASLIIIILLLAVVGFGCQLPFGKNTDYPVPPEGNIPVSQEAADRLKDNFRSEMAEAASGDEFRLFITNEEITSLVALTVQDTAGLPLSDPQVWFTAGRVYMTGTFSPSWPFRFNSLIVATAVVREGRVVIEVQQAQMGPFPFPQEVLQTASDSINQTLAEMQLDLQISTLEILEGELQLAGTRRAPE